VKYTSLYIFGISTKTQNSSPAWHRASIDPKFRTVAMFCNWHYKIEKRCTGQSHVACC